MSSHSILCLQIVFVGENSSCSRKASVKVVHAPLEVSSGHDVMFIISAIAGIILKPQQFNFFQLNFCRDFEYLLKNLDNLFGSEW